MIEEEKVYCSDCIHYDVCGMEDVGEKAIKYCANKISRNDMYKYCPFWVTNRDIINQIPNEHFHNVYFNFVLKDIGLNYTDSGKGIGKWLEEEYHPEDYIWKHIKEYFDYVR